MKSIKNVDKKCPRYERPIPYMNWILWHELNTVAWIEYCGMNWILWHELNTMAWIEHCGMNWILWHELNYCGMNWILWHELNTVEWKIVTGNFVSWNEGGIHSLGTFFPKMFLLLGLQILDFYASNAFQHVYNRFSAWKETPRTDI
jgi:hypothetical protein